MGKRAKRYHSDIFFPESTESLFEDFKNYVYAQGPITFSGHSLSEIVSDVVLYGTMIHRHIERILKGGAIQRKNMFEFYVDSSGEILKACFRYEIPLTELDLVLVISKESVVITSYIIERKNRHSFLNKKLYNTD